MNLLLNLFIGLAVNTVKAYVNSTSSKNDDKILDVAKIGVDYLASKHNNTVTYNISKALKDSDMRSVQSRK